jgi:hypothetical protein
MTIVEKRTPKEEALADMRNATLCLVAIMRKFDTKRKSLVSVWYETGEEVKKIETARAVIKENLSSEGRTPE